MAQDPASHIDQGSLRYANLLHLETADSCSTAPSSKATPALPSQSYNVYKSSPSLVSKAVQRDSALSSATSPILSRACSLAVRMIPFKVCMESNPEQRSIIMFMMGN